MHESCFEKQSRLKEIFESLSREERYAKIIDLGRALPPFPKADQTPENLVPGCQSQLYLTSSLENDKLFFEATSDALISKGLAALLLFIYNGESPKTVLLCPPTVFTDLKLSTLISPTRSNGLASLHTRLKQAALSFIQTSL